MIQIIGGITYLLGVGLLAFTFFPFSPMTLKLWMPKRETMLFAHQNRVWLRWIGSGCLFFAFVLGGSIAGQAEAWLSWAAIGTGVFFCFFWWGAYVPVIMAAPQTQQHLTAQEADAILQPDDDVLGVVVNGEAKAYSRTAITRPHMYNDTVGGVPLAVTYCILCNSGVAFQTNLGGYPLKLQPVTAFNNNIVYYDPQRRDYIQQLEGKVIAGPDEGKSLSLVPVTMTSWQAWKTLHADTRVLHQPETYFRDRMLTWMLSWMIPLAGLLKRRTPWHPLNGSLDTRLPAMTPVVGVKTTEGTKAYPVSVLRTRQVVEDAVGGAPLVVLYAPDLETVGVFSREIDGTDGRVLSFRPEISPDRESLAADTETSSLWNVEGKAISGMLQGQTLTPIAHFNKMFWFSWAAFYPHTHVFAGEE